MKTDKKDLRIEKEIHLLMANQSKHDVIRKILAGYKLLMLAKTAAGLIEMSHSPNRYRYLLRDLKCMIISVLHERRRRLNAGFKWTEENRARFLLVNDQIFQACLNGWNEAAETAAALEKRIKREDSFLKDYEIEVSVQPYPNIGGNRSAAEIVECYLAEESIMRRTSISHPCYKHDIVIDNEDFPNILIDKGTSWNHEYFNGEFDDNFICYPIHCMLDEGWSFTDILSVRKIWVDVKVIHQHHKWLPKFVLPHMFT